MSPGFKPDLEMLSHRTYTISEACDLLKVLDRNVAEAPIRWRNVKTGREVFIGYNDDNQSKHKFRMVPSKSMFIPQTKRSPKTKEVCKK